MSASSLSLMPEGLLEAIGEQGLNALMKFLLTSPIEPATLQTEAPASGETAPLPSFGAVDTTKRLRILLVSGPKDHGPDEHDYPLWQQRWSKLLPLAHNVVVSTAQGFPSREALQDADVAVFYSNNPGWSAAKAADLASFQQRGGGLVYVHFAVDGHNAVRELGDRIGLAWRSGHSKFRHGPLDMALDSTHPIMRGLSSPHFHDESYWDLEGDPRSVAVVATGVEDGVKRPLMWTRENGAGRVFVSIPGHYTWTFDDPVFRLMLLRGICWAAHEPVDRLSELATIGARINASRQE
jgi:type 1 glutamine amidotransferase